MEKGAGTCEDPLGSKVLENCSPRMFFFTSPKVAKATSNDSFQRGRDNFPDASGWPSRKEDAGSDAPWMPPTKGSEVQKGLAFK